MSALSEYYDLMARLFESRHNNAPADLEDTILDDMDLVWQRMSTEERKTVDELSRSIATGAMSEEQFIETYTRRKENALSSEQQAQLATKVKVTASSFIQTSSFSVPWSPVPKKTQYIGFTSPPQLLNIQKSSALS
jgi:hypothetical protein